MAGAADFPSIGIRRLVLRTACPLPEMRDFYANVLGLSTKLNFAAAPAADPVSLAIQAGTTTIEFLPVAAERPIYHFAFNIPENLLAAARRWLHSRVALTPASDGEIEHAFPRWNAHALYFDDPAGNILEFIARHDLTNARSDDVFSARDILYASEIGIVVDDVPAAVGEMGATLGLVPFRGLRSEDFTAVGSDDQLLILVRRGRPWHAGDGRIADVFPTQVELSGAGPPRRFGPREMPYEVSR